MENLKQRWQQCLQLIREKINDPWVYNTWFSAINIERYDEQQKTILLQVPSQYVYEFLEHYYLRLLTWAIGETFQQGIRLQYRIVERKAPGYIEVEDYLLQRGLDTGQQRLQISIPDARERLRDGLLRHVGENYKWLPAYDRVAEWLNDNRGRGLLCIGTGGLGKTVICRKLLPVIIGIHNAAFVSALDMHKHIDTLLKERVVIIDDLGKEPARVYGEENRAFLRLCDAAEQNGNLLIINTRLSTTPVADTRYPTSIQERYGTDVLDRLRATTRAVLFEGENLRIVHSS